MQGAHMAPQVISALEAALVGAALVHAFQSQGRCTKITYTVSSFRPIKVLKNFKLNSLDRFRLTWSLDYALCPGPAPCMDSSF